MGPFCIVVGYVLRNCPSEVLLANRHQPVEILLLYRPDDTFGVRIRIRSPVGRLHDAQARVIEVSEHGRAPLRVAITDQQPVVGEGPVVSENERADHLLHEQGVGMRRGAEYLHATTRQIEPRFLGSAD